MSEFNTKIAFDATQQTVTYKIPGFDNNSLCKGI